MPKIVGDYKVIDTLGHGSFSTIKKVINIKTDKFFAMKIAKLSDIKNSRMEAQIKRRINILTKMDHPGIIKLRRMMHSKNNMFLIFDLEEGEFFSEICQHGPISEELALEYFHQLIDIIDYVHKHNAVLRDLRAENLLVDADGNLKITDFIFSNMFKNSDSNPESDDQEIDEDDTDLESDVDLGDVDDNSNPINLPLRHFAAPEALHEEGYIPEASDIWSAGVILYHMLSGDLPFDAPTPKELEEKIKEAHVSFPAKFPTQAQNLLKLIFISDPEKRCTMTEIKKHPWFRKDYTPIIGRDIDNTIEDTEVTVHLSADTKINHRNQDVNEPINVFELIAKLSGVRIDGLVDKSVATKVITSFTTARSVTQLKDLILDTLDNLGARVYKKSTDKIIKAIVPICSKEVEIKIELSKLTDDLSLVEICRLKGNQIDYMRVYKVFRVKLK
ncbi:hypothetical protein M9Y10_038104 [Tritrichomonas musculus]|uniref:non-specific serine/threonine protein kinase n=1 Tax=Tritrichomonas musculus TaxID=1915356 RepID=A0ABR2K882_9EUKA